VWVAYIRGIYAMFGHYSEFGVCAALDPRFLRRSLQTFLAWSIPVPAPQLPRTNHLCLFAGPQTTISCVASANTSLRPRGAKFTTMTHYYRPHSASELRDFLTIAFPICFYAQDSMGMDTFFPCLVLSLLRLPFSHRAYCDEQWPTSPTVES